MNLRISILDALDDPALLQPHFRGPSWTAWRGFLAALFALEPNDSGEAYRAATGRQSLPELPFSEAALIVGRRGGKSRILALIAVCLACFRDYTPYLAPGEVATIAVLAANRSDPLTLLRVAEVSMFEIRYSGRSIQNAAEIPIPAYRVLTEAGNCPPRRQ